jgi:two-component system response regulator AtoC
VLEPSARTALRAHAWPGNVRELNHVVERAVVLADGESLSAADLELTGARPAPRLVPAPAPAPAPSPAPGAGLDLRTALADLERQFIRSALERAQGNRTAAAAMLGLNRTTLVEKLRKYA